MLFERLELLLIPASRPTESKEGLCDEMDDTEFLRFKIGDGGVWRGVAGRDVFGTLLCIEDEVDFDVEGLSRWILMDRNETPSLASDADLERCVLSSGSSTEDDGYLLGPEEKGLDEVLLVGRRR